MTETRRSVLRRIGAGTVIVGASGMASAQPFADDGSDAARVRVLHASPDAPAVDVFVDGEAVLEGVTFTTLSGYLELPAGSYDVAVAPAGAGADNAVIEASLTLSADTDYTVAAVNRLADITAEVFVDDNDGDNGQARVRAVHFSPDAPAVDVAQTDGPGVGNGSRVVAGGLSYRNATGYLELPPTAYTFEIRPAGASTAVSSFDAPLEPGATYTVFALGLLNPDAESQAFQVLRSEDGASIPARAGNGRKRGRGRGN